MENSIKVKPIEEIIDEIDKKRFIAMILVIIAVSIGLISYVVYSNQIDEDTVSYSAKELFDFGTTKLDEGIDVQLMAWHFGLIGRLKIIIGERFLMA